MIRPTPPSPAVRWRSVAIPAEHGGWGMLFGPILLGLLVVPSLTAVFLALLTIAAFLARAPLKIVYKNRQRGRRTPRAALAIKVLGLYSLIAIFALAGALLSGGPLPLLPTFLVLPLAALLLYYDLLATSRKLLPELIAPLALSSSVAGMALAAGWDWPHTLGIWAIPLMSSLPAVLFVRARIRLDRGMPAQTAVALGAHIAAALLALLLVQAALIPQLAAVAIFLLLGRALYALSPRRRPMAVKTLGWSEIAFSLLTVLLSAVGYWGFSEQPSVNGNSLSQSLAIAMEYLLPQSRRHKHLLIQRRTAAGAQQPGGEHEAVADLVLLPVRIQLSMIRTGHAAPPLRPRIHGRFRRLV